MKKRTIIPDEMARILEEAKLKEAEAEIMTWIDNQHFFDEREFDTEVVPHDRNAKI